MKVRRQQTSAELRARPAERCQRCKGRRLIVVAIDAKTTAVRPCPRCQRPEPPARPAAADVDLRVAA